jgi:hypothetical protein
VQAGEAPLPKSLGAHNAEGLDIVRTEEVDKGFAAQSSISLDTLLNILYNIHVSEY